MGNQTIFHIKKSVLEVRLIELKARRSICTPGRVQEFELAIQALENELARVSKDLADYLEMGKD